MHTAVMMTAVAVLGFLFRLFDGRGILVPLGFGLAFGRAGIRVFGFRGLAFLPAFVLGRRIGDALVEDACQDALEVLTQIMQILEGQFGLVELAFGEDALDDGIDVRPDTGRRGIRQRPAGSLHGVRQHEDGAGDRDS